MLKEKEKWNCALEDFNFTCIITVLQYKSVVELIVGKYKWLKSNNYPKILSYKKNIF